MVAEYDGELAGAVFLRLTTLTAVNLEPVVEAVSPHVFPQFRRHGIGSSLMECAVTFADELGAAHVMTAAASGSRDANRFMARLGLGPFAVTRVASAPAVRAKVTAQRPGLSTTGGRHLTRVLAARRSMKRTQPLPVKQLESDRRGVSAKRSAGSSAQVIREVQTRWPRVVGDDDLVARRRATQVDRGGHAGDGAGGGRAVVGGVDVDADGEPVGVRMQAEPTEPRVSARTTDAPPCSRP